jgi:hypothetical protein
MDLITILKRFAKWPRDQYFAPDSRTLSQRTQSSRSLPCQFFLTLRRRRPFDHCLKPALSRTRATDARASDSGLPASLRIVRAMGADACAAFHPDDHAGDHPLPAAPTWVHAHHRRAGPKPPNGIDRLQQVTDFIVIKRTVARRLSSASCRPTSVPSRKRVWVCAMARLD